MKAPAYDVANSGVLRQERHDAWMDQETYVCIPDNMLLVKSRTLYRVSCEAVSHMAMCKSHLARVDLGLEVQELSM